MIKSDSIAKIAPALLAAQKNIGAAKKESTNPFYKSSYADLGAVMQVCKDELNKNGISVLQPVGTDEQGVYVETLLLHESGEFIADKMRIAVKGPNDPQAQGSAITYARRYGLQSMVFIPAEDDDGEKATGHQVAKNNINDYNEPPMSVRATQQSCLHTWGDPFLGKTGYWWKKCPKCQLVKPTEKPTAASAVN